MSQPIKLRLPTDFDDAVRRYETDPVVYLIVNIVAREADVLPVEVLRENLGDTLHVQPEQL